MGTFDVGSNNQYYLRLTIQDAWWSGRRLYFTSKLIVGSGNTYYIGLNSSGALYATNAPSRGIGGNTSLNGNYTTTEITSTSGWVDADRNGNATASVSGSFGTQYPFYYNGYQIGMSAVSTGGSETFHIYTVPSAPTNISLTGRTGSYTSVTATASGAGGPDILEYQIAIRPEGGGYGGWYGNGTTLTGLSAGTTYYLKARARSADGWGSESSEFVSWGAPILSAAPTVLVQENGTKYTVTSAAATGPGISEYNVAYRKTTDSAWSAWSANGTTFTLDATADYVFKSRALGYAGWSLDSLGTATYGVPSQPSSISTTMPLGLKITVSCGLSIGQGIQDYYVSASPDNGVTWQNEVAMGLDRSYQYTSLSGGKNYKFRVRAKNNTGFGAYVYTETIFVPAGGKRWTEQGFVPTATVKRRTDTGWEIVTIAKRWSGTSWEVLT